MECRWRSGTFKEEQPPKFRNPNRHSVRCLPPACRPRSLRRAATADDTLDACLFSFADMPGRTKCVAYVLRALMIMMVISSDEMAAVHPEPASFNGKRRLPRTTSDLAYES